MVNDREPVIERIEVLDNSEPTLLLGRKFMTNSAESPSTCKFSSSLGANLSNDTPKPKGWYAVVVSESSKTR